jgi:hypothetical protein
MMVDVHIDIEISTRAGVAVGRVAGRLTLAAVPVVGAAVSFVFPMKGNEICPSPLLLERVRVEQVIFSPQPTAGTSPVLMLFEDVVASDHTEALRIAKYLQEAFGLKFEDW